MTRMMLSLQAASSRLTISQYKWSQRRTRRSYKQELYT